MIRPEECKIKCDFIHCFAGMGLAGNGVCFLQGMWWANCPDFLDESEELERLGLVNKKNLQVDCEYGRV